jgi:hypothetical protein
MEKKLYQPVFEWFGVKFQRPWFRVLIFFSVLALLLVPYWFAMNRLAGAEPDSIVPHTGLIFLVLVFVFALNFLPYVRAENREAGIHLLILTITILSFYAFGWPKEMEHLKEKFAEICVILVLFVMSELAVHLTFSAKQIETKIKSTGDSVVGSVQAVQQTVTGVTATMVGEGKAVANAIETAQQSVTGILKKITELELEAVAKSMRESSNRIGAAIPIVNNANECGDPDLAAKMLEQFSGYVGQWARCMKLASSAGGNSANPSQSPPDRIGQQRALCWFGVLEKYLREEIDHLKGETVHYKDENGIQKRVESISYLATNEGMYLNTLGSLAETVGRIAKDSGSQPVFRAITNILPEEWYNWPIHRPGRPPIADYREVVKSLVKSATPARFERLLVVAKGAGQAGQPPADLSESGVKPAAQLLEQCTKKFYLSIRLDGTDADIKEYYRVRELNGYIWTAFPTSNRKPFPGTQRLDSDELRCPILELPNALLPGFNVGNPNKAQGFTISAIPLWKKFIEDLHHEEKHALVVELTEDDMEMLPRKCPDMLMVGLESGGKQDWLMAVSSDLKVGDSTMLMYLISDPEVLADINKWWEHHRKRQSGLGGMQTLRTFCGY